MTPSEAGLWRRMTSADRRHAVVVARRVETALGPATGRPVLAAALLHDVGKIESGIGPFRRAAATVAGMVGGRDAARQWRRREGVVGRAGRYLCHDEIGAELLRESGSDALTIAWAREHHLPPERWTVAPQIGAALKAADDA
jgi:HD domain